MYCPRCSQEQVSEATRFCSRCGFLLTGVTELLAHDGVLPQILTAEQKKISPRKRGLRQGGIMFLLGVFVVPLVGVLSTIIRFPRGFIGLAAIVLFLGGLLRMIYALIFESSDPHEKTLEENVYQNAQNFLGRGQKQNALPPQQTIPTSGYVPPNQGSWRDTKDLVEPSSVTEQTTKLLQKDD
jgi:hypothetical protein